MASFRPLDEATRGIVSPGWKILYGEALLFGVDTHAELAAAFFHFGLEMIRAGEGGAEAHHRLRALGLVVAHAPARRIPQELREELHAGAAGGDERVAVAGLERHEQ